MSSVFVELLEPNGSPFAVITEIISLDVAVVTNAVGTLTVTIPENLFDIKSFKRDAMMRVYIDDFNGPPIHFARQTFLLNKITRRGNTVTLSAPDVMSILENTLVAYTSESLYASKTNEEADISGAYFSYFFLDDLMKEFFRENLSVDALDPDRNNAFLTVEGNKSLAPIGEKEASFATLLSTFTDMARQSDERGTPLFFSLFPNGADNFIFRVWSEAPRRDRGSTSDNPLVLSEENGDLDDVEEVYDHTEVGNVAYGLGGGSGSSRVVVKKTNDESLRGGPFSRREFTFDLADVDHVDESNEDYVDRTLAAALQGKRARVKISARINDGAGVSYGRDYEWGDRVVAVVGRESFRQFDVLISAARLNFADGKVDVQISLSSTEFI